MRIAIKTKVFHVGFSTRKCVSYSFTGFINSIKILKIAEIIKLKLIRTKIQKKKLFWFQKMQISTITWKIINIFSKRTNCLRIPVKIVGVEINSSNFHCRTNFICVVPVQLKKTHMWTFSRDENFMALAESTHQSYLIAAKKFISQTYTDIGTNIET